VIEVLDREPVLSDTEWRLAEWIASYYVAPPGLVLRLFFPPGATYAVREGDSAAPSRSPERIHVIPPKSSSKRSLEEAEATLGRAPQQKRVWQAILDLEDPIEQSEFCRALGVSSGVVRALAERGLIRLEKRPVELDPYAGEIDIPVVGVEGELTIAQEEAVTSIRTALGPAGESSTVLLEGITGSGKTRVYVEAVDAAVTAGGKAIVLVPEIGLAAPTVSRFRHRFGDRVAVLHSGLSDGERIDAWRRIRDGERSIVIGARSALFAPVGRASLIVVDEEHETAYKQDETPRYHARDVAVVRASLEGATVVLGSATPSLETRANADGGKYGRIVLPERIANRPLPEVEIVNLSEEETMAGPGLSRRLAGLLDETLRAGDQAILFLNRRGFAVFLQCPDCGWVAECPSCLISLTYHRDHPKLLCHYCAHHEGIPASCPSCAGRRLDHRGIGTQQIERAVTERFPEAKIGRMDLDTTGAKWAHARIYRAMQARELDILVGTQMIAKGFDLPGVALVGVISADTALHMPDFRAAERTFQLLVQVAGRAGRGERPGRVVFQTYLPSHPAVVAASAHDYEGFYRSEVVSRSGLEYPPASRLANLVVSGTDEREVEKGIGRLAARLGSRLPESVVMVGPAPCPLERLRGRSRHHCLLKSSSSGALGKVLWELSRNEERWTRSSIRLEIDLDPMSQL
jgi:primosomal protein N' (replication factor Y)